MEQDLRKDKIILYKIAVSIILGLAGFLINFFPVNFEFPGHRASFMFGMVFPMIVTLAWGWKYGLLSATLGLACQNPWFLWYKGGWAPFVSVPPFTLWIVWHGWCAEKFRKAKLKKWNTYLAEIPFRIFNILLLFTIFRWVFQFNPPPWDLSLTKDFVPLYYIKFITIKGTVNAYIILLIADVLLSLKIVKKVFRLKVETEQSYIVSASILIGCFFWVFDSILDYFVFYTGKASFLDLAVLNVPLHKLFYRFIFIIACLIGGLISSKFLHRQHESEKRFKDILISSDHWVWEIDLKGIYNYCSEKVKNILGYSSDEMLGKTLFDFMPPIEAKKIKNIFNEIVKRQEPIKDLENWYIHKNYKKVCLLFNGVPIFNESGNLTGYRGVNKDITDRKHTEKLLQRAHIKLEMKVQKRTVELKNINKELESFAYSVSHDLRAPLRTVDGFSKILLEEYADTLDRDGKHYLQRIRVGAQDMDKLIDGLLNLSRIGRQSIEKKMINFENIARESYNLLEYKWKGKRINFVILKCPSVLADPQLMKVVFVNLISNTLKFTRKRKTVKIKIGCEIKDKQKIFFIKDNGVGFDMKYADKLFIPFQRLHRKEEYEGIGIGLATVQRIISRHGGKIWVESQAGLGTTFYFTI